VSEVLSGWVWVRIDRHCRMCCSFSTCTHPHTPPHTHTRAHTYTHTHATHTHTHPPVQLIYRQYVNLTSFSEPQPVVSCCLATPEDLAVDWLGRNLYWTDSTRRVIEVAKLNGKGCSILAHIPASLGAPSLIALDPTRG